MGNYESNEFKTEQRILNIMKNPIYTSEDVKKVLYAFENLKVLRKDGMSPEIMSKGQRAFELGKKEYNEKMNWINIFMKSKDFSDNIFTDLADYRQSCDDYDYYYGIKTITQYKEEQKAREEKKNKFMKNGRQM